MHAASHSERSGISRVCVTRAPRGNAVPHGRGRRYAEPHVPLAMYRVKPHGVQAFPLLVALEFADVEATWYVAGQHERGVAFTARKAAEGCGKTTMGEALRERTLADVYVLIVDDSVDGLEVLRGFLEYHGAFVRSALSASSALEMLEHVTPDLIITDLAMPGMSGEKLLTKIRKRVRGVAIPVVALTAYPEYYAPSAAQFDAYLTKPLDPKLFFRVVAPLVGR